ncbi:MAG: metal-sensing transcriptional repressor [Clostridiaceae bacterium]|nr:metal-sensing transcriptional repressor [Clostridiaceae bacterium]
MKADKEKATRLIKTARGQLDGLLKMIEEDRYCLDISNQLMAAQAILRKVNRDVIQAHLENCVKEAFQTGQEEKKIEEIMGIVDKLTSN